MYYRDYIIPICLIAMLVIFISYDQGLNAAMDERAAARAMHTYCQQPGHIETLCH